MISKQKINEWLKLYLDHIKDITPEVHVSREEGYKIKAVDTFQSNFNVDAENFAGMLEKAIENNNLVLGPMYFPKRMLVKYAQEYTEETRLALKALFNENKDVAKRIDEAQEALENINIKRNKRIGKTAHSFMTLRFLSFLLAYKYPLLCNPIKPREWKDYCKFIDESFDTPSHSTSGEKYKLMEPYIEALRLAIKDNQEVVELKNKLTSGLNFQDHEFRWMTQDVIFVTARILAMQKSGMPDNEVIPTEPAPVEDTTEEDDDGFGGIESPQERFLEDYIVQNWDEIDFGEKLSLYVDEDGAVGRQYSTDVGIIDILAKDTNGNFVVIELKKGVGNQKVIGQILSYMGWVRDNIANGKKVRGIIIARDENKALKSARSVIPDAIELKKYQMKIKLS